MENDEKKIETEEDLPPRKDPPYEKELPDYAVEYPFYILDPFSYSFFIYKI